MSPLSNAFLKEEHLQTMEPFYPLHAYVCGQCFLVQLEEFQSPQQIFKDYAYFSSYSKSWLEHSKAYVDKMIPLFSISGSSQVIEIASNDGYLLKFFKEREIPVLGIEPAENVAKVAQEQGIETLVKFFGEKTARELISQGIGADLLLGNNVLAHVPDINDFVKGLKILLKKNGVITLEFPHLLSLMEKNQFDTIYHEHFSYLSFLTVEKIFAEHGLTLFDVEQLPTHGGSLRIYAGHTEENRKLSYRVHEMRELEKVKKLDQMESYNQFAEKVKGIKRSLIQFLIAAKEKGKKVVGYGAPAKGNTLLNYCGIRSDFLDYTVDISPHKQGCFLPGTHIPIHSPKKIEETKPDYLLLLPWNLKEEIMDQTEYIRSWGGKFVIPIPALEVVD